MSARLYAAGILAALTFTASANAADLYGENYYPPRDDVPYDERYAERAPYPPPGAYDERCDDDACARPDRYSYDGQPHDEYPGSIKDGYATPVPPHHRYAERWDGGYDGRCIPRWQIRRNLRADGWTDLRPLEREGAIATIRARRHDSGRIFTLRVDRCSGEIVDARPHYLREFGAYSPRPWHRGRAY